jgi:hypothetical protein
MPVSQSRRLATIVPLAAESTFIRQNRSAGSVHSLIDKTAIFEPEADDGDPSTTRRSAPSRAVESFAQQIRVAVVPGVLLDHVDIDPA